MLLRLKRLKDPLARQGTSIGILEGNLGIGRFHVKGFKELEHANTYSTCQFFVHKKEGIKHSNKDSPLQPVLRTALKVSKALAAPMSSGPFTPLPASLPTRGTGLPQTAQTKPSPRGL